MKYTYKTQGTCSSHIELEIENNIITDIAFWGGCNGNLQGLSRLVKGMSVNDVISRLEGVRSGSRIYGGRRLLQSSNCRFDALW